MLETTKPMRFSVWPALERSWNEVLELAQRSEATGWDGFWVADHFMVEEPGKNPTGVLEVWSTLAGLAAATNRITLGSLVCSLTYRHPAVLASAAVTCDHISSGRFVLGVGAGWQENEHQAYGFELGDPKARSDRLEDGCRAIRGLVDGESWTMQSRHFEFDAAPRYPKPIQERLPLLVGGKGERRTLRIAALYADWWNAWVDAEALRHKRQVLHRHCEEVGRDPDEVSSSTQAFLCLSEDLDVQRDFVGRAGSRPTLMGSVEAVTDQVGQLYEAGTDELIVPDWTYESLSRRDDELDQFISEVVPSVRA